MAKIFLIGNPRCPPWRHLGKLFFASSPESKGLLTLNLVGIIGVTCRSKIAKIVLLDIQDGRHGDYLESLFFASSPEAKEKLTRNLVGSIGMTGRSKVGKIVHIGNPKWHGGHLEKSIFRIF